MESLLLLTIENMFVVNFFDKKKTRLFILCSSWVEDSSKCLKILNEKCQLKWIISRNQCNITGNRRLHNSQEKLTFCLHCNFLHLKQLHILWLWRKKSTGNFIWDNKQMMGEMHKFNKSIFFPLITIVVMSSSLQQSLVFVIW